MISLPYSKGFQAYVDGQKTELKQANTMYMALELKKGAHEIRLTYCTPYLKAGLHLDLCRGIVLHLCGVSLQKEKRKEKTWVDYLSYFRLIMRN